MLVLKKLNMSSVLVKCTKNSRGLIKIRKSKRKSTREDFIRILRKPSEEVIPINTAEI